MKTTSVELRDRLYERLERYATLEGLSIDELLDHICRGYSEQLGLDDLDEEENQ